MQQFLRMVIFLYINSALGWFFHILFMVIQHLINYDFFMSMIQFCWPRNNAWARGTRITSTLLLFSAWKARNETEKFHDFIYSVAVFARKVHNLLHHINFSLRCYEILSLFFIPSGGGIFSTTLMKYLDKHHCRCGARMNWLNNLCPDAAGPPDNKKQP